MSTTDGPIVPEITGSSTVLSPTLRVAVAPAFTGNSTVLSPTLRVAVVSFI